MFKLSNSDQVITFKEFCTFHIYFESTEVTGLVDFLQCAGYVFTGAFSDQLTDVKMMSGLLCAAAKVSDQP